MTAAQGIMARASEAIGRAVAAAGSVVYAAAGSVLGSPPVPPVVLESPRAVWVVAWRSRPHAKTQLSAWATHEGAWAEKSRLVESGECSWAMIRQCEVRT